MPILPVKSPIGIHTIDDSSCAGEGKKEGGRILSGSKGRLAAHSPISKDALDKLEIIFYGGWKDVIGYFRLLPEKQPEMVKVTKDVFIKCQRKRANDILNWCDDEEVRP